MRPRAQFLSALIAVALPVLFTVGVGSAATPSSDDLWRGLATARVAGGKTSTSTYKLDRAAIEAVLASAPKEREAPLLESRVVLTLPLPDGSLSRFRVEESPVFEPELAAQHPEIRSFRGQGIDLPGATIRFDLTPLGFHALMLDGDRSVAVYPESRSAEADYISVLVSDARREFACGVVDDGRISPESAQGAQVATGSQLRTYRIAISTTGEFTQDVGGGTVGGALAALNTLLNGINAIYERDLAVHMNLIAGLNPVIFTNAATDPYSNGNTNAMYTQVAATLGANIPTANYDIGHVIGTNSGGLAGLGIVCDDTPVSGGPRKSQGVSAAGLPVGNSGDINLISHEIGHQFGAPHSFNAGCSGNRSALNGVEPGSGVTIMSYNGVCAPDNTVGIGELRFHSASLALMNAYIATEACQVNSNTGNGVPTVNAGPDRTIPVNTPFTLTAIGSDPDGGDLPNLTYTWEQVDPGQLNGGATDYPNPPYQDQLGDPPTTTRPILRAYASTSSPSRTFPNPSFILNNANDPPDQVGGLFTAEELPRVARTLNFRVTVRDNRAGAGGTNDDAMVVTVSGSGPFQLTAPNGGETWVVGTQQNVTWNVNGTNNAPVSCANVKISLSTDGGATFPIVLAASAPNDGSETITVPAGLNSGSARVKVEAVGNIFFDVSNGNFTINAGPGCPFVASVLPGAGNPTSSVTLGGSGFTGVTSVRFSNNIAAAFTVVNDATITTTVPAGAVTGPITLSKAGCPDVPTGNFIVCPNPSLLAQIDDGSGETFWSGRYFVNRLTPTGYPATLTQVVMQLNSTFGVPAGSPITVLFGANPGGTADLGGVVFQTLAGTSNPDGQFKSYDVPPLTINSGDFVVGFNVTTGDFPGFSDTNAPAGRSYGSSSSTFGSSTLAANLLVRARYHVDCGGGAITCPTVTNLNPASGPVASSVIITGTNFTGVSGVTFTNSVAAAFTVDNDTQITATVPPGATTGSITITKPGCTAVQTGTFTVTTPNAVHVCAQPGTAIPDNDPNGITSNLNVLDNLTITNLTVGVNIPHTFIGDLIVELRRGATVVRLHNRTGAGADNIVGTYPTTLTVDGPGALTDFNGQASSGTWTLFVSDNEGADVGSLVEWCLDIQGTPIQSCPSVTNLAPSSGWVASNVIITGTGFTGVTGVTFSNGVAAAFTVNNDTQITATVPAGAVTGPITIAKNGCPAAQTATFTVTVHACAVPGTVIPDNNPTGITSDLNIPDNVTITNLTVSVNIPHTYIGDLIVELRRGATIVRLHNQTGGATGNIVGTYPTTLTVDGPGALADFVGQSSSGTWTLFVSDNAGADVGTLNQWCLDIQGTPVTTGVAEPPPGPLSFRIAPNPTIEESSIRLSLPQPGVTRVQIVDLAGRLVRRLHDGWIPAGPQEFRWDGRDRTGAPVESGIYFVAVDGVGVRARGKLVVSR